MELEARRGALLFRLVTKEHPYPLSSKQCYPICNPKDWALCLSLTPLPLAGKYTHSTNLTTAYDFSDEVVEFVVNGVVGSLPL